MGLDEIFVALNISRLTVEKCELSQIEKGALDAPLVELETNLLHFRSKNQLFVSKFVNFFFSKMNNTSKAHNWQN